MKVRFTERAFQDREQIFEYLAERSPAAAANVMARLRTAIGRLSEHPESGYQTDVGDVRVMFVGRYSYKIFYRIADGVIEILHIRHTSRRPGDLG